MIFIHGIIYWREAHWLVKFAVTVVVILCNKSSVLILEILHESTLQYHDVCFDASLSQWCISTSSNMALISTAPVRKTSRVVALTLDVCWLTHHVVLGLWRIGSSFWHRQRSLFHRQRKLCTNLRMTLNLQKIRACLESWVIGYGKKSTDATNWNSYKAGGQEVW